MERTREGGMRISQWSEQVREYAVRNGILDVLGHPGMGARRENCTDGGKTAIQG